MKSLEAIYGLGVSHNRFSLPLPDGSYYPEYGTKIDERPMEFLSHFNRVRDKPWEDCTFMDLGCSEGSTTFGISQMGSTVYGVEGRADGVERAKTLRDIIGFDKTHFAVGNVVADSSYRPVDGIFNAGVLYHLDDPIRCLEQCAANARLFFYLDTGHMPLTEEGRRTSKFAGKMGKTYKVEWRGLSLDAMNFREPTLPEKSPDGMRRQPRSAIGNSHAVWLTHAGAIEVMAKLGFPYHETVADRPHIPRLRTCFFRSKPRSLESIGPMSKALPKNSDLKAAVLNARERDIAYLQKTAKPVIVVGREPMLRGVVSDLRENGIAVSEVIAIPGEGKFTRATLQDLVRGKSGMVAAATKEYYLFCDSLVLLDSFDYVFTSFAMARENVG